MGRRGIYGALRRLFTRGRSGQRCAQGRSASASRSRSSSQARSNALVGPCVEARALTQRRAHSKACSTALVGPCVEVQSLPRRRFQREAAHAMAPEEYEPPPYDPSQEYEPPPPVEDDEGDHVSREELDALLKAKFYAMSSREQEELVTAQKNAKDNILRLSRSGQDLMMRADNLIDQDWLGKIDEMPGNIYRIAAFGGLQICLDADKKMDILQNVARLFGTFLIFLVQLIAPPALFFTYTVGVGTGKSKRFNWGMWCLMGEDPDCAGSLSDWHGEEGFWLAKTMGLIFVCLFSLNGLFVILDERRAWKQLDSMLRYLDSHTPRFEWQGEWLLYLDAFMNCWVVFWCTLDSYLLVGASRTMKDVLFDSLSLLFLYNLDDISGDLGFVNTDDWDGLRLGWIYDQMVKVNYDPHQPAEYLHEFEEDLDMENDALVCLGCYNGTVLFLEFAAVFLPILALITPFGTIAPDD